MTVLRPPASGMVSENGAVTALSMRNFSTRFGPSAVASSTTPSYAASYMARVLPSRSPPRTAIGGTPGAFASRNARGPRHGTGGRDGLTLRDGEALGLALGSPDGTGELLPPG